MVLPTGNSRRLIVKVGDLLRSRSKLDVGVVRIYTDDQCDSWETHMKKDELVVFLEEHQNQWGQDVLTVLFPRGIRWLYRLDVEVIP
jgi:hypothetical protein